ncbi:MAG: GAF domain-containing protein, partial [Myxococcota bacterium]|nr:GAF domain-containing protein [Myxococcota bacterium]
RRDEKLLRGLAVQGSGSLEVGIPIGQGIAGQVALRNRSINLKDAYRHPDFDPKYDKLTGYRTRSMLCVPMRNPKQEVIGVVQVLNKSTGYFTVQDERLLTALATQAAITLEALHLQLRLNIGNAELRDLSNQLRQKIHELELLYDNERAMAESDSLAELSNSVLNIAARVAGCECAALFLPDESGFGPMYIRRATADDSLLTCPRLEIGEGLLGYTANLGRSLSLRGRGFAEANVPQHLGGSADIVVDDAIAVPLLDGERTIGALALINRRAADHRDEMADEQLGVLLAGQLARAVVRLAQRRDAQRSDRLMTIGQMLSGVLHDLKGPMSVISGYSQLMAISDSEDERKEMASAIRRQVASFNAMTREVMAFARGERRVFARKVYLEKFVRAVVELIGPEFEGGDVQLVIKNEAKKTGFFDEGKMLRVVANIARNARQAMDGHGAFTWTITDTSDGGTMFRLDDDGPGIPESIRDTLFEAFTTSGKPEGTGLGLAIVRRIVEDHGGSVSFTTETGVGTTFIVKLPGADVATVEA